jgi:ribosomal protein L24E
MKCECDFCGKKIEDGRWYDENLEFCGEECYETHMRYSGQRSVNNDDT